MTVYSYNPYLVVKAVLAILEVVSSADDTLTSNQSWRIFWLPPTDQIGLLYEAMGTCF
jgi:hypothetical protein